MYRSSPLAELFADLALQTLGFSDLPWQTMDSPIYHSKCHPFFYIHCDQFTPSPTRHYPSYSSPPTLLHDRTNVHTRQPWHARGSCPTSNLRSLFSSLSHCFFGCFPYTARCPAVWTSGTGWRQWQLSLTPTCRRPWTRCSRSTRRTHYRCSPGCWRSPRE